MPGQIKLFAPRVVDPRGEALDYLKARCLSCVKCDLHKERTHAVFGEGNRDCPLVMFVGEAPGKNEDQTGRPFVGRSGEFLNRMIRAMGFEREEVYLANAVACRPPDNRPAEKPEIKACSEFLVGQIRGVRPSTIVTLGATAFMALTGLKKKIGEVRGKWTEFEGIPVLPTYHPAAVARAENQPQFVELKKVVWADLQKVLIKLGRPIRKSPTVPSK